MIEERERVIISGVEDVDSFNESEILLLTVVGSITVVGSDLHISKLNLEDGQLVVEGYIVAVEYADPEQQKRGGLFSRMLGGG